MDVGIEGGIKRGEIQAVVIGVDGKVRADLGKIGYYHRNPIMRFFGCMWTNYWATKRIKRFNNGNSPS